MYEKYTDKNKRRLTRCDGNKNSLQTKNDSKYQLATKHCGDAKILVCLSPILSKVESKVSLPLLIELLTNRPKFGVTETLWCGWKLIGSDTWADKKDQIRWGRNFHILGIRSRRIKGNSKNYHSWCRLKLWGHWYLLGSD